LPLVWQQSFVKSPRILGSMRTCRRAAKGIVVPSGGSTPVILVDGRGLEVRSTMPSKVYVY
jgi:hypothetical protein